MVNVKLDGKKEAERLALFLEESERCLGKSLTIFQCDGRTEEGAYVRLKREMGERLGVNVKVKVISNKEEVMGEIVSANEDETIDGILIQLPIFDLKSKTQELKNSPTLQPGQAKTQNVEDILEMIKPSKDVDGLNPKSSFLPAVVRAVERVIEIFRTDKEQKIAVVGARGMVGKRIGERLKVLGFMFTEFDKGDELKKLKDFEVVITATGVSDLITEEMVQEGFVGIDLGYPKGEFSVEAGEKASLITPVPGGVGPLTVVELYENLAEV